MTYASRNGPEHSLATLRAPGVDRIYMANDCAKRTCKRDSRRKRCAPYRRSDLHARQIRTSRHGPGKRRRPCSHTSSPGLPWCASTLHAAPSDPRMLTLPRLRVWNDGEQQVGRLVSTRVKRGGAAEHGGRAILRVCMEEGT